MSEAANRARKALDDHAWQDAYDAFVSLRDRGDLGGEDWEGLGQAAWWSAHPDESLEVYDRERREYAFKQTLPKS